MLLSIIILVTGCSNTRLGIGFSHEGIIFSAPQRIADWDSISVAASPQVPWP